MCITSNFKLKIFSYSFQGQDTSHTPNFKVLIKLIHLFLAKVDFIFQLLHPTFSLGSPSLGEWKLKYIKKILISESHEMRSRLQSGIPIRILKPEFSKCDTQTRILQHEISLRPEKKMVILPLISREICASQSMYISH